MTKAESVCRHEEGFRNSSRLLTGVVVVSFDIIQVVDCSVFGLEMTTNTRLALLFYPSKFWDINTKKDVIGLAAVSVLTFLMAVFLSAALPKAKPGRKTSFI